MEVVEWKVVDTVKTRTVHWNAFSKPVTMVPQHVDSLFDVWNLVTFKY